MSQDDGSEPAADGPRAVDDALSPEDAANVGSDDLDDISILFVDDERQLLSILASKLKEEIDDLEVVTASHATEALEMLDQLDVDCVVSDYKMPGRNGLELLEAVRERSPGLPFILFTSQGSEDIATEAINADVTDYLQKDLGEEQLVLLANRIENAVSQYRAQQEARDTYQHVRRIHDRISDAFLGLDSSWTITYVDEQGAGLLEGTTEELHGKDFWEVLPGATGTPFETEFERALESGEPVDFETHYDPFETWFEVRAFPADDGLSVYFRDITDLKEREAELERQGDLLEAIATDIGPRLKAAGRDLASDADATEEACDCDAPTGKVVEDAAEINAAIEELERLFDEAGYE
jgi:DNA-binding NarL/FixJ family response regulator